MINNHEIEPKPKFERKLMAPNPEIFGFDMPELRVKIISKKKN